MTRAGAPDVASADADAVADAGVGAGAGDLDGVDVGTGDEA